VVFFFSEEICDLNLLGMVVYWLIYAIFSSVLKSFRLTDPYIKVPYKINIFYNILSSFFFNMYTILMHFAVCKNI
jgi:hypothetical protein